MWMGCLDFSFGDAFWIMLLLRDDDDVEDGEKKEGKEENDMQAFEMKLKFINSALYRFLALFRSHVIPLEPF